MRSEDKKKIESKLNKGGEEKLLMARFFYGTKECLLYPSTEIEYDSFKTIRYEDILDAENSNFKTVRILKEFFPNIKKVFVYYNCLDGGYTVSDQLKKDGWDVINNDITIVNGKEDVTPMYETSCYFIFVVPKNFKLDFERDTEIDGVTING